MSLDLIDLHTLIVRAHDRHKIPFGKVMRVALQAAAKRKFPLYKGDGSRAKLSGADRTLLLRHAAIAEQQTESRWWTKKPWIGLCEIALGIVTERTWLQVTQDGRAIHSKMFGAPQRWAQ